jgi:WD40 repeat protein
LFAALRVLYERGGSHRTDILPTVSGLKTVSTVSKGGGGYASIVNRTGEITASETARSEFVLFDSKNGAERGRVEYSGQFFESASFGPKERYLVLQRSGGVVQLVDAVKGREQAVFRSRVFNSVLAEVRPDKRRVVVVGRDGVQVWSTEQRPGVKTVQGYTRRFAVGPTGDFVARADSLGGIRLIGLEKDITDRVLKGHSDRVSELTFSPEGKWLASASRDRTVRVWKPKTGNEREVFRHAAPVEKVAFAQNGTRIVAGYDGSEREEGKKHQGIVLWNRTTQRKVATLDSIAQFHVTPDGSRIITEIEPSSVLDKEANLVRVRSARTGNLQAEFDGEAKIDHLYGREALGDRYALGYRDSVLHILDIGQGKHVGQFRAGDIPRRGGLALGPEEQKIAVAPSSGSPRIEVFSLANQKRLFTLRYPTERIRGQPESVHFVEFDPQGEHVSGLVTTAAGVGIPAVWKIPQNEKQSNTVEGFSPHKIGPFDAPSFSPSGRYVLAQGKEEIRVYDIREERGRTTAGQVMQVENQIC